VAVEGNVEMQNMWFRPWRDARWIGSVGLGIAVGVSYFLAAHYSLAQLTKPDCVAVFWPAAGIAAGTLIGLGPKARVPVTLAVLIATTAAGLMGGRSLPATTIFSLCNCVEVLVVASLIRQHFGRDFALDSLRNVLGFFAAAAVGPALLAIVATAGFVLFYNAGAPLPTIWLNWFASDALGIIMVAPLLIGLGGLRRDLPERWELTEGTLTLAALGAVSAVAFGSPTHYWWYTLLPLGLFLPSLLAAHCRPVFAAAAALILGCAVVSTPAFGELPDLADRAHAARATLLAISVYTLVLAALFAERRRNERALEDNNNRLKGTNHRLQLALDGAALGVWSVDTATGRFESDARNTQIHGYPSHAPPKTLAAARPFIHPSDLPALDAAFFAAKRTDRSCKVEYRLASAGGSDLCQERWVATEGTVVRDNDGRPLQLLGVTRDVTEHKQAERILAERNLQLSVAAKAALVGTYTYDVGSGRYQVSPGYAAIHGLPEGNEETTRAEWRTKVHPSDLTVIETGFEQAMAERRAEYYCEYRFCRPDGEIRWIDSRNFISYDHDGSAPRVIGANIDVTQRKATEAALEEHKASLADALVAGKVVAFEWDAITRQTRRSDNAARILGDGMGGLTSPRNEFLRRVHPDDRAGFKSQIHQLSPGEPSYILNFRFRCRDGREIWLEETARGEFDGTGRLLRIKGLTRDITERKKAELALGERTLQLALAGKAALAGSYAYDTDTEIMQISAGYAAIHGLPESTTEIARSRCLAGVHPDDIGRVGQARSEAFSDRRREYSVEYRFDRGGELRWVESRCFITYDGEGRPERVVGVSIDITERKRVEEQQRILVSELDHRVKNVLATVSAIVTQTQDPTSSLADFVTALDSRIRSLARTHELLSQGRWSGVSLAEIARRELAPYAADNVEINGPSVTLKAEAAQAMAMVLHELTTNAAKYGAFSGRNGRVLLCWRWLRNGSSGRLAIEWQEIGGPQVRPPRQCGYGTGVIGELIPFELGGTVALTFPGDGVRCRIEIPAEWVNRGAPLDEATSGGTAHAVHRNL
jgi:PAS domain S-box-containing protein